MGGHWASSPDNTQTTSGSSVKGASCAISPASCFSDPVAVPRTTVGRVQRLAKKLLKDEGEDALGRVRDDRAARAVKGECARHRLEQEMHDRGEDFQEIEHVHAARWQAAAPSLLNRLLHEVS